MPFGAQSSGQCANCYIASLRSRYAHRWQDSSVIIVRRPRFLKVSDISRTADFEFLPQAEKELDSLSIPVAKIVGDLMSFGDAWRENASQQVLYQRFSFKVAHHAECARRGILLYEIYICNRKCRAIVAWFSVAGPGYWVAIFKKQGTQSRTNISTAGDRAVRKWRALPGHEGNVND